MTTKSSIHNVKTNLTISSSVNNMSTHTNDLKSSRISIKRPMNTSQFLSTSSTSNGLNTQFRKRTLKFNNLFNAKIKPYRSNEQTNGHQSQQISTSPPLVFHAIAPVALDDSLNSSPQFESDTKTFSPSEDFKKSNDDRPASPASRRIANVLAHTKIKAMSTDRRLHSQSSVSEDEEKSKTLQPILSAIDADADESDNGNNNQLLKFRRFQKTRKCGSSSQSLTAENNHHQRQNSSSNEEENQQSKIITNGTCDRRLKPGSMKISEPTSPSTTTDDDLIKHVHRYHPLDDLQSTMSTGNNESSPIPTITITNNQPVVKKINRFQVKSIRKSQQQEILLANTAIARSSNEDDCSVPNGRSSLHLEPPNIERRNTNTSLTDSEQCTTNNDLVSRLTPIENGHHVRFHVTTQEKKGSIVEEQKLSNHATTTLPAPAPPSSTTSVQEDDEEEAIAKSPDGRFIKYAKEIGRGAFKTVYRGLDTETSVAVAWCELQEFAQFDKHERARFKEEAEMLKKLQHPNIVRFYDFWEETNPRTNKKVIILVTELMTSGSLKGYIRKFKGQKEDKRINVMKKWCRQILKGLAYLHGRHPPVIHRDLKCDNVFVSSTTGSVKIGDLGLATFKTQTFAKSMRGTMEFMAPEMFDEQYDELVDIYSFGLCMLEMITGEYPYIECKGPTAVIKRVTAGLKPDCYYKVENEDVREVIDCCIRTHKEERLPVNELLQHSFFLDDNGLRIDFVRDPANDLQVLVKNNSVDLKLKVIDKNKRKTLWTEHEAILFRYNFTTDTPEQIVDELIEKKYIFEDDKKFIIQSIKDRLRAYQYEQIDRKAGVFSRERASSLCQMPLVVQHHQQPSVSPAHSLPPPAIPLLVQPQIAPIPTPSLPTPTQPMKLSTEIPPSKPTAPTEPIPISQLSELSSSVSGSAGSLEILDAALKKTFHKNNTPQSTSTITTITSENGETPVSLVGQDESSISKLGIETAVIDQQQQQQKDELVGTTIDDLTTSLLPSSTSSFTLLHQSQATPRSANHQSQILHNPLIPTHTSQSFTYSAVTPPPSSHPMNPVLSTDPIKLTISHGSSSSSIVPETFDNSHTPISPSQTNETNQSSLSSELTPQPPALGSLKQLDALLKSTFKNPSKSNGTAHNSDTESTHPNISLTITDDTPSKSIDLELPDSKRTILDLFHTPNSKTPILVQSQPTISLTVLPKSLQQAKSQPTSQFDPFISPERTTTELDTTIKTPPEKSSSNDDTITAVSSSSNDLVEIKTMLMDLSKNLFVRMNTIEQKIDEHRQQTIQINTLLTQTILPSLADLADIISQTPIVDSRVRTKLENIQRTIRTGQQQTQQIETKDLMEI